MSNIISILNEISRQRQEQCREGFDDSEASSLALAHLTGEADYYPGVYSKDGEVDDIARAEGEQYIIDHVETKSRRRGLVVAASFIVAEIERIDRENEDAEDPA